MNFERIHYSWLELVVQLSGLGRLQGTHAAVPMAQTCSSPLESLSRSETKAVGKKYHKNHILCGFRKAGKHTRRTFREPLVMLRLNIFVLKGQKIFLQAKTRRQSVEEFRITTKMVRFSNELCRREKAKQQKRLSLFGSAPGSKFWAKTNIVYWVWSTYNANLRVHMYVKVYIPLQTWKSVNLNWIHHHHKCDWKMPRKRYIL